MLSSTTTIEPDRAWSCADAGSTAISTAMRNCGNCAQGDIQPPRVVSLKLIR